MATGESVQDGTGAETADPGCDQADPLDDLERAPSTLSGRFHSKVVVRAWLPDAAERLERAAVLIEGAGEADLARIVRRWFRVTGLDRADVVDRFEWLADRAEENGCNGPVGGES